MLYDISVRDSEGKDVKLDAYKGKVLLIINSATGCGLTPQYNGIQKLYDDYKDQGFEVLDFPCNQFANQAPGEIEEIKTFCESRFGVTFKVFDKIDVNGDNADPLFKSFTLF
jgi:glutathione peroxidase